MHLQWGTYDVAYVAYDTSDNTAKCDFKIYVLESFCPPLDPPEGGRMKCEDWGPGGRFKVCRIFCEEGMRFSQEIPEFYTCGAEGFWRPNLNAVGGVSGDPNAPLVFPACSKATKAQKIFKIKLSYIADVLCNEAGKGVLESKITDALEALNKEWKFSTCSKFTRDECQDWGININCNQRSGSSGRDDSADSLSPVVRRFKRQAANSVGSGPDGGGGSGDERSYELEISFPTIDNEEVTNDAGQRERIERILESIILEGDQLNVKDKLPNVVLDKSSIDIDQEFACKDGEVVRDNQCGTY